MDSAHDHLLMQKPSSSPHQQDTHLKTLQGELRGAAGDEDDEEGVKTTPMDPKEGWHFSPAAVTLVK